MANIHWYVLLGAIGIAVTIFVMLTKKNDQKISTLLAVYLFAAGLTWIGEFIVLGIFESYAYKTGVFTDIWAQNLLGHLILNTTLYPAGAVVMVAYGFSFGWISLVAFTFIGIEYVFLKLGIYEQYRWKYYMTFLTVASILFLVKKMVASVNEKRAFRTIIFYFVAMLMIHIPAPVLLLLGKQQYQIGFVTEIFGNPYRSSVMVSFSYHLIESLFLVYFVCVLKNWRWKIAPFVISILTQSLFLKMGILTMKNGWPFIYTLLIYELFRLAFIVVEAYTLKEKEC